MIKINEALDQFKQKKILVIGDVMLDKYVYGKVSRISPEAPVPVLLKIGENSSPGGASNVANNLASLGASVSLCGIVGEDNHQKELVELLKKNYINTDLLVVSNSKHTTVKYRFVADNHQFLRLDEEDTTPIDDNTQEYILSFLEKSIDQYDGIVFSDYVKGCFVPKFTQNLIKLAKKHKKIIVADIKPKNKASFKGVDVITPNIKEAQEMSNMDDIEKMGKYLINYFDTNVVLTKGSEGMSVFLKEGGIKKFSSNVVKVFDVSGAGDTVVAVIILGLVSGLDLPETARLANFAGGLVVQKPGTATVSLEELRSIENIGNHLDEVKTVQKVWGYEKWLVNNEKYCSKLFFLRKGYQCSLHYHKVKDETFLFLKGQVRLEVGDKILYMREGNFYRIEPGVLHRFRGLEDSEFLEVSTHHDDEDSYRLEKSGPVRA